MSPAEASTKGLAAELAATGQAQGARVLCPVPYVTGATMDALAAAIFMLHVIILNASVFETIA